MKGIKKSICIVLAVILLVSVCGITTLAGYTGEERTVIGADLGESDISAVYDMFGIERGSVSELFVTNSEERTYLENVVSEDMIGTNSISSVYIKILSEGEGLDISTTNIDWCTVDVYQNALVTAGIYDAKVIIAAPFEVSGTAALTGIYKAYEDITGKQLDTDAKEVATEELVVTSELADEIGSADAAEIVNELKKILDETGDMSDDELREQIIIIADNLQISLSDSQIQQLIDLVRQLEKLDASELISKVEDLQNKIKSFTEATEKASGFFASVGNFIAKIGNFFANLFKR